MRCANCGNNAAKIYEREADGKVMQLRLCPACFRELYKDLGEGEFFAAFSAPEDEQRACPTCGTTFADFRASGLLGCAYCYTFFHDDLIPAVRSAQGHICHVGSAPSSGAEAKYDETLRLVSKKKELESRLELARRSGDRDAALRLRAQLREVDRSLYGGESEE